MSSVRLRKGPAPNRPPVHHLELYANPSGALRTLQDNGTDAAVAGSGSYSPPIPQSDVSGLPAALAALPQWLDLGTVNAVDLLAGPVAIHTTTGAQEILGLFFPVAGRVIPNGNGNLIFTMHPATANETAFQWLAAIFGGLVQDTPNEAISQSTSWPVEGGTVYACLLISGAGNAGFVRGAWQANHAYAGDSANNNTDQIVAAGHTWSASDPGGTSGGSAPDFAGNIGGTVLDNDITWTDLFPVPTVGSISVRALVATPSAP